jgi:FkbM family methyltransferase
MNNIQGIFFRDFKNAYIPHILKELYLERAYDDYFTGKKDLTILDIGANVGLFSFFAYQYASRIYAIEPASEHFSTMLHMLKFNKMDKVSPLNIAMSTENGKGVLHHNENVTMHSLRPEVATPGLESEEVDMVTFDKLFSDYGIEHVDFMKIDTEGSEIELLASPGFKKVMDKIDNIYGEYHVWSGVNKNQLANMLTDYGYNFEWVGNTDAHVFKARR